jgi:hypothetical protein
MTRWLIVAALLLVALVLAMVSVPLLLLLLTGAVLGWVVMEFPSMRPQQRRVVGLVGVVGLVLGGGLLLFNQFRSLPERTDGPFSTAYRQSVTLRDDVAEVEERYIIEAEPGITLTRILVEGEGTIQTDDGSLVEGMTVIPNSNSVAFTVNRPPATIDRTPLGFRFWETTLPLLRTTVVFRRPENDQESQWPVVRCLNLDFQMVLEATGGRLVGANPEPERLEGNEAEWRSLNDFDPTDFSPQVEVQVDQVPPLFQTMHNGVRSIGNRLADSFIALIIGGIVSSTATKARKQLKRKGLSLAEAKAEAKAE